LYKKCFFQKDGASKQNVRPRRLTLVPTVYNSNNFRTLASSKIIESLQ